MTTMGIIAALVFLTAYVLITTEKLPRAGIALGGAGVMLALRFTNEETAFHSLEAGIDWNVIGLLLGMMIIVGIIKQTGVFEYLAIAAAKRAKGSAYGTMALLLLITGLASALLDNVTTVLLIAPVTFLVCERIGVNPVPYLIAEVLASNIGGTATLIGDPPNIIIASRADLSFNHFVVNLGPIALLLLILFIVFCRFLFRKDFQTDPERVAEVMALNQRDAIQNKALLIKCGVVLVLVMAGFVLHTVLDMAPSVVALLGAGLLVVISRVTTSEALADVEWETLVFFMGLFIMVGALVNTDVIGYVSEELAAFTGGRVLLASMVLLFASALLSGVVDNIPFVATMAPVVGNLIETVGGGAQAESLWWSLALGADLGGNMTAVGASANVVVLGIAARNGHPISFWKFTRYGALVATLTVLIAAPYLWLRYFVLG